MNCHDHKIDETKCPVCGQVNKCQASEHCWCFNVKGNLDKSQIKKVLPKSIRELPTTCLCQTCWAKYQLDEPK